MVKNILLSCCSVSVLLISAAQATEYVWKSSYASNFYSTDDAYPTPLQACQARTRSLGQQNNVIDLPPRYNSEKDFQCVWQYNNGYVWVTFNNTWRLGTGCSGIYNILSGECLPAKEEDCECADVNAYGNYIDPLTGTNFQRETDFVFDNGLLAERYYNSRTDSWRHAYSYNLKLSPVGSSAILVKADGRSSKFSIAGGVGAGEGAERGRLESTSSGWRYTSVGNEKLFFNADGKLTGIQPNGRRLFEVTYGIDGALKVTDPYNSKQLVIEQDLRGQPKKITYGSSPVVVYEYNSVNMLSKATRVAAGQPSVRSYYYEDATAKSLLTKIVDEKGNPVAAFTYANRKVVTATYGGFSASSFAYSGNNTRIQNALGKFTNYHISTVDGKSRINQIEGEQSPNCSASTSYCEYNARGLIQSKTDRLGRTTLFDYNQDGLEVSRTEAAGTPLARTTNTTWNPGLLLPASIQKQGTTTTFQYDSAGRVINKVVTVD